MTIGEKTQQTLIQGTGIPRSDDREAAILQALPPGNYTAILYGKNSTMSKSTT